MTVISAVTANLPLSWTRPLIRARGGPFTGSGPMGREGIDTAAHHVASNSILFRTLPPMTERWGSAVEVAGDRVLFVWASTLPHG